MTRPETGHALFSYRYAQFAWDKSDFAMNEIIRVRRSMSSHTFQGLWILFTFYRTWDSGFRIFCFFDDNNLVVIGHGFQKKTQRTPEREIERGEKIKRDYYEEKTLNKSK